MMNEPRFGAVFSFLTPGCPKVVERRPGEIRRIENNHIYSREKLTTGDSEFRKGF
jgi:hypothetical protein